MNTVLYRKGIRYSEREYKKESDIEELVINNSKTLFGNNSIYIDAKKKIDNTKIKFRKTGVKYLHLIMY